MIYTTWSTVIEGVIISFELGRPAKSNRRIEDVIGCFFWVDKLKPTDVFAKGGNVMCVEIISPK